MFDKGIKKARSRERRHRHIRRRIAGTPHRPRLTVYRSLKNIYAQLVDDVAGRSIVGASSLSPEVRERVRELDGKCEVSREVGRLLATRAKAKGIAEVVFDRSGYRYHGRVKALAEGAREGGLQF
ncbi:MAG TPA: 50S ribosomal protein L18 [Candidatus Latescibacteria bacterium]|nr:50S ribosomal protein L18 [Candidatus Latescibacterota bacterium]